MVQDNCEIEFKSKKRKTQSIQIQNPTPLLIGQSENIYFYESNILKGYTKPLKNPMKIPKIPKIGNCVAKLVPVLNF